MDFEERAKEGLAKLIQGDTKVIISAKTPEELVLFSSYYDILGYDVKSPKAVGGISYPVNLTIKKSKEDNYNA